MLSGPGWTIARGVDIPGTREHGRSLKPDRPRCWFRAQGIHALAEASLAARAAVETRWPGKGALFASYDENQPRAGSWDLEAGWDGAAAIMAAGRWDAGLERMTQAAARVNLRERADGPQVRALSVVGTSPCVPVALAGAPAHMWRATDAARAQAQRPIVRIGVSWGMPATADAMKAAEIGVRVLRIAQAVERSGARVELVAYYAGVDLIRGECVIKAADAPPSLAALSCIVHPATARRSKFAITEYGAAATPGIATAERARRAIEGYDWGEAPEPGRFHAAVSYRDWNRSPDDVEADLIAQLEGAQQ